MRLPSFGAVVAEVVDPRVVPLVARCRPARCARRPRSRRRSRPAPTARGSRPRGRPRGQRREQPGRRIDDLDRDVVAGDEAAEPLGDALEDGPRVERRQDRFGDLQELALAAELALERGRLLAQALGRVGVGHRLGGEAGVDDEQPQVVVAELVEPELREDEDAEDLVLEHHRREEHRLVEVVLGARDRVGPRVGGGVAAGSGRPGARRPSR